MTTPNQPQPVGLVVRFTIRDGCERQFDELAASTVAQIRHREPQTLLYICHTVENDPRARIFYELYADQAAFQDHENQPHVQHFLAAREALLDQVDVDWVRPHASKAFGINT